MTKLMLLLIKLYHFVSFVICTICNVNFFLYICTAKTQLNLRMFDFFFRRHREMLPLPYKREVHCHVLPGLDDGSDSFRETSKCLKAFATMGVEHVVCTPHRCNKFHNTLASALPVFEQVKAENPIVDSLSFEYRIDETIADVEQFQAIAGKYVIIEDGFNHHYHCLEEVVDRILCKGLIPVLAHPERYSYLAIQGIPLCAEWKSMGLLFQCNMLSFAGFYGNGPKEFVNQLFDSEMIDFMGSDLHNSRYADALMNYLKTEDYAEIRDSLQAMIMNDLI